ncbi:MAG: DUF1801 domain-containing protein [bacterium]|nr:DUF1801 domain-containing protein [bacterium]
MKADVDKYLAALPPEQRAVLAKLRATILSVAKDAEEKISYGMPTVCYHGNLVHYAAFKNHMSLFGASAFVTQELKEKLANFKTSKGTIQFTVAKPLPVTLVKAIVKSRIKENEALEAERKLKKRGAAK